MHVLPIQRRQAGVPDPMAAPTVASFSGEETAALNTDASSLLINTAAPTAPAVSAPPLNPTSIPVITSNSSDPSSSQSGDVAASTSGSQAVSAAKSSISVGAVVGACLGAFAALLIVLLLVIWTGKRGRGRHGRNRSLSGPFTPISDGRNAHQNADRRKSGRELWLKMDDEPDAKDASAEKYAMSETDYASGGAKAALGRSVTVRTSKTHTSYGAGLGLAHTFAADTAPQLEFTDSELGKPRAQFARDHDPISWDGETIADDSFLTMKSGRGLGMDGAMSPSMVVSRQTPQATVSVASMHQWSEAEVVSPDVGVFEQQQVDQVPEHMQQHDPGPAGPSKNPFISNNPFSDDAAVAPSHPYAASLGDTSRDSVNPAVATQQNDDRAMRSLLAALNISREDAQQRLSAAAQRTPRYSAKSYLTSSSKYSDLVTPDGDDEEDIANLATFPLPPTDFEHHR